MDRVDARSIFVEGGRSRDPGGMGRWDEGGGLMAAEWRPKRFIDAEIEVEFDRAPALSKKPGAPDRFHWDREEFHISEVVSSWFDYGRRGDMARNMAPAHLEAAHRQGSWGVGRFYFRVRTAEGPAFDLYYDRAPREAGDRTGIWVLWREVSEVPGQTSA